MKSMKIVMAVVAAAMMSLATPALATNARLQVIHNAADPAAAVVDVYVNGDLLLDEFGFRTATPFIDVPAGVELRIGVAPGGDSTPADIIAEFPVTLAAGKKYVAVANGVLDPSMFAGNPGGAEIGFNVFARDGIRERAYPRKMVSVIGFHGATDAPAVDIVIRGQFGGWEPMISNLAYGEFSRYRALLPWKYTVDVTPAGAPGTVVASFEADLTQLKGGAAVLFASGFLDPTANQNGPAFGLFAALPNGQVVELPPVAQTARLQVVHNAADPAAAVVDVYVGDDLLLNDFAFRTATPFVDVPANTVLKIGVAPGSSSSVDDVIASFDVTLDVGKSYVAFANGVLDPSSFASNPSGREIGFTIIARGDIWEENPLHWLVKVVAFHGATDAPAVDIRVANGLFGNWKLVNNLAYGDFSDCKLLLPREYVLDVTPAGSRTAVASFKADLQPLKGGAAVVFASGFLDPSANQGGPAFGLFAVLADGTVAELPPAGSAALLLADEAPLAPTTVATALNQNSPNPFNPQTAISFSLAAAGRVNLNVYNARGQLVQTLVDDEMPAGAHTVQFNASRLASGVYFYRLNAGSFNETRRMVLLK